MTIDRKDHLLCELPCLCGMLNGNLSGKKVPGNDSRNLDTDLLSLHVCATTVWVRVFLIFFFFFFKVNLYFPCMTLHVGKRKDTASKLQPESQWPRFSVRGQKPLRMVDMESHDAQSCKAENVPTVKSPGQHRFPWEYPAEHLRRRRKKPLSSRPAPSEY